ncbi:MAG TPA: MGMT family protein [Prolixibacteraceae bacterium]|nr:MGMT family protein [Prolixibacteraceae bacterium]
MGSDFFDKVYQLVRLIPAGRVSSYGAIARYLGSTRSARMVGWAMNSSHTQHDFVPAHRVVNREGLLTGKNFFGGENVMQELLENEGLIIKDNQIINFKECFWDPNLEL